MAEADRVIADVTAALVRSEARPEAILTAVVDTLAGDRPAMWIASLLTKDPARVRVIARDEENAEISEYIDAMQHGGGLSSAPIATRVIESGEALLIPRISPRNLIEQYLDEPTTRHLKSNRFPADIAELSILIVPLRAPGVILGTLGMYLRQSSAPIVESDVRWLQSIADQTGVAVQNAQLSQDAKNRLDKVEALRDVLQAITSSQDPSLPLNIVVHRVTAVLDVDACDVLLVDDANQVLVVESTTGFLATAMGDFRLPLDNPLIRQAMSSRRVEDLKSGGALDHARRRSLFAREGFRTYAAFPLTSRGRWLGALEIFNRSDLAPDAEWFQFLDSMAAAASIAVDSARIQERLLEQAKTRKPGVGPNLSAIETQILGLVVEGLTNREIAAQVHLSQSTIKFHVRQILDKTGAANRTDLTRRATREGWV